MKWTFSPKGNTKPVYLVCNCDESEPGTFKDRFIVHQDPHQLLEGMIIACYAVQAHYAVIYMREEFPEAARIMNKAIGLHPAVILLSLSMWGSLLGLAGMIIALPATSLILSYYRQFLRNQEAAEREQAAMTAQTEEKEAQ